MQKNNIYNLIKQYEVEHKSLWRIKHMYQKDAKGMKDQVALWKRMEKDKEEHVKELGALIKKLLK